MFARRAVFICLFTLGLIASPAIGQTTYYVNGTCGDDSWAGTDPNCVAPNGPFATIQAGIDAAVNGDTVIVADGVYTGTGNKNLSYNGKAITVRSENGPATCIIDCQHGGQGVSFTNLEPTATTVFGGFTIRNGNSGLGGAIYFDRGSATIVDCRLLNNRASTKGGAIYAADNFTHPIVRDTIMQGNSTSTSTTTSRQGGAIYMDSHADMTLERCEIVDNVSLTGGGIYALLQGTNDPTLRVESCVIARNTAVSGNGGGIYGSQGKVSISNTTLVGNRAGGSGGALNTGSSETAMISNSILWDNAQTGSRQIVMGSGTTLNVEYSDIQDGPLAVSNPIIGGGTLNYLSGNIDVAPGFAFSDDYHLCNGAPVTDAGTASPLDGLPSHDLDDNPRNLDGDGTAGAAPDMGAYEFNSTDSTIATSPKSLTYFANEGGPDPPSQTLSITNAGGQTLNWEATSNCSWLTPSAASGDSTGEVDDIALNVDINGLSHGLYTCEISIADPNAVNEVLATTVALSVNADLSVPLQYATIQAAVDAAIPGDTVIVADGVYTGAGNRGIQFIGKAPLTVKSENGPLSCVIDCQGTSSGFVFDEQEGPGSVIEGFTVLHGNYGVRCDTNSSPTIRRFIIRHNTQGIRCADGCSAQIENCIVELNGSLTGVPGGIACHDASDAVIVGCLVSNNLGQDGAGIRADDSNLTISNCSIVGNTTASYGGGCRFYNSQSTIENSVVWGNTSLATSAPNIGLVDGEFGNGTLDVSYSNVEGGEAGVTLSGFDPVLNWGGGNIDQDSLFALAEDYHLQSASPCRDAGTNTPAAGVPATDADGNPRVVPPAGTVDMGAFEFNDGIPVLALSPLSQTVAAPVGGPNPADILVDVRNAGGGSVDWQVDADCSWLSVNAPSGDSSGEIDAIPISVDVNALAHGAYTCELTATSSSAANAPRSAEVTLYVTTSYAVPSEFSTIQAALDTGIPGDEIVVADGTYVGTGNRDLDFGHKAMTLRSENGPTSTIIDAQNASGVAGIRALAIGAKIDGFTVTHGSNGGIHAEGGTVSNCRVIGNSTAFEGGGISGSRLTIVDTEVMNNSAATAGGIYCTSGTIERCLVSGNSAIEADSPAGGIYAASTPISDSTITNNHGGVGGGLYCIYDTRVSNCRIEGNVVDRGSKFGGGVYVSSNDAEFRNCLIVGNQAVHTGAQEFARGGGVYAFATTTPTFIGCTIADNLATDDGGGLHGSGDFQNCILWGNLPNQTIGGTVTLSYSDVEGGAPGTGNIDADPLFSNPAADNYHLASASPCVDTGDPAFMADPGETDIDGDPRIINGRVDMGADERAPGPAADFDGDGDVDAVDFGVFSQCFGGANNPPAGTCPPGVDADLDNDGDVDAQDFGLFGQQYTGSL